MNKVVEVKNLSFTYPDGTVALKKINLDIYEDESIGIIGPNGAGKSTLLLHFNGILHAQEGEIKILGLPYTRTVYGLSIDHKNLNIIRQSVGLVFQDPDDQLFMPTVFDDVAFGPLNLGYEKTKIEEKVKEALTAVGLSRPFAQDDNANSKNGRVLPVSSCAKGRDLPDIGKRLAHHLSLGEKKRVSLATVLAQDLKILLLDEPTSNLDARAKKQVLKIIQDLPLVKIIATHDLDLISTLCNRVVVLDQGEKITEGETKRILTDEDLLEKHGLK